MSLPTRTLGYLPNLCLPQTLLRTVIVAEFLAIVLALTVSMNLRDFFTNLGLHSLFVQWVVLASILLICLLGRFYPHPPVSSASAIVLGTSLGLTLAASILGLIATGGARETPDLQSSILFVFKNLVICLVITLVMLRYFYIQNQWEASVQADSEAKYDALQSRMRPHFLFNSMNAIAHLVHKDPHKAEEALLDVADIMRTTLDRRTRITLQEELDLTIRYLRVEGLRLGKRRLTIAWDMDRNTLPLNMEIPPLLLQPLVENAIYHGIQPRKDGGMLGISLYDAGDRLDISVTNPLPLNGANAYQKGNHIAQENMKKRLRLAFGDRANLKIQKNAQQYRVSFSIPKE